MRSLAAIGLVMLGCHGYPRGGGRAHHVQADFGFGTGGRRTTGVRDDPELSKVASSARTSLGLGVRAFTASGHGGGARIERGSAGGGTALRVSAIDVFYTHERNVADGAVSLAGYLGPSRTTAHVTSYCYSDPASFIDFCGGQGRWLPPPDLHAYDHTAWGGVLGASATGRAGSFLVGVDLAWRATRPVDPSPVGWNHTVMAQLRVGLDVAVISRSRSL